jgi:hypothetical protein
MIDLTADSAAINEALLALSRMNRERDAKDPRLARILAAKEGTSCATCGRHLTDDEPIWRCRFSSECMSLVGLTRRPVGCAPVCGDCWPKLRELDPWARLSGDADATWKPHLWKADSPFVSKPCSGCGRRVVTGFWLRYVIVCSDRCARQVRAERRRARPIQRQCSCGRVFTPPRRDGWYCSNACRQRAYRQRQAS